MQYVPSKDGLYVYFRYDKNQTVMVVMNTAKKQETIDPKNYAERIKAFTKMKNIISREVSELQEFSLPSMASGVWELMK
jgi:galactokinase